MQNHKFINTVLIANTLLMGTLIMSKFGTGFMVHEAEASTVSHEPTSKDLWPQLDLLASAVDQNGKVSQDTNKLLRNILSAADNAERDAWVAKAKSVLQSVRAQMELYNFKNGKYPKSAAELVRKRYIADDPTKEPFGEYRLVFDPQTESWSAEYTGPGQDPADPPASSW